MTFGSIFSFDASSVFDFTSLYRKLTTTITALGEVQYPVGCLALVLCYFRVFVFVFTVDGNIVFRVPCWFRVTYVAGQNGLKAQLYATATLEKGL